MQDEDKFASTQERRSRDRCAGVTVVRYVGLHKHALLARANDVALNRIAPYLPNRQVDA